MGRVLRNQIELENRFASRHNRCVNALALRYNRAKCVDGSVHGGGGGGGGDGRPF